VVLIGEVCHQIPELQQQSRLMERFGCGGMDSKANLVTTQILQLHIDPAQFKQYQVERIGEA
jgi:hypothetical protein